MIGDMGITQDGLKAALLIKNSYRTAQPICVPGEKNRILMPENLLNPDIDLQSLDDPLALAMMATRDPESPMAVAAAARLGPQGAKTRLVSEVVNMVGQTTRHPVVRKCIDLITESAFDPGAIDHIRRHATRMIDLSRREFTAALKHNLRALLDGAIAPRDFVREFFTLTEAGNMRHDIRKKLVLSLLLADSIRPSIKFLMLENFTRMPSPVRVAIITGVLRAKPSHHIDVIKDELKWIVRQDRLARQGPASGVH